MYTYTTLAAGILMNEDDVNSENINILNEDMIVAVVITILAIANKPEKTREVPIFLSTNWPAFNAWVFMA